MNSLCGVWWCQQDCHDQYLPQVKESLLLKDILCIKRRSHLCLRPSYGTEQNKTYGVATKRMNFICPVIETSRSIEPNDNDFDLNTIAYTFSKIFQPEIKQVLRRVIVNYLPTSISETYRETGKEKRHFLCCGRFHFFWWHLGTQTCVGGWNKTDQIDNKAKLFWGSISKTKHQSLTSLAFMRLVPGANRVVRHVCIQCIANLQV